MIRLNCCSHVFALETCRAGRYMVGKAVEKQRARGWATKRRVHDLSPPHRVEDRQRREAMSVTSGNYARVPVAIGLLILLGACWVRSLLALRLVESVAGSAEWRSQRLRVGVDSVGGVNVVVGHSHARLVSDWWRPRYRWSLPYNGGNSLAFSWSSLHVGIVCDTVRVHVTLHIVRVFWWLTRRTWRLCKIDLF